jgi:hypothetical protein
VILLGTVLSLAVLLIYPGQLRHMPRSIRWLPPALRILAIIAIVLSILRPVVTRTRLASERAPVLVLIDNSRSMGVTDANRPPGEWVGIAAAMGRLPPDSRDKLIAVVQADCDRLSTQADDVGRARDELAYAKLSGKGIDAAQARLDQTVADLQSTARDASTKARSSKLLAHLEQTLVYLVQIPVRMDKQVWLDHVRDKARDAATAAESARLGSDAKLFRDDAKIRDACLPLQSLSRLQISESALLDPDNGLLARLGPETSAAVFGISDRAIPIGISRQRADQEPLNADGNFSNLNGGIRAVLESLKASPPRAVVLFSDGRQVNADNDPATLAAITGIPVFTIGISARTGLKDLSIISANVNANAIVGETITFTAQMQAIGMNGTSTDLTFTAGGIEASRKITFPDERPINVTFTTQFKQPGEQRLGLDLAAIPGEVCFENNHIERWVNVSAAATRPAQQTRPATRPAAEAELADITGDEYWLRHLADLSGGQFFRLDQIDLLPKKLADIRDDVTHPVEIPLWDGPYLFELVLGCLAAEWGIRKRYGLA